MTLRARVVTSVVAVGVALASSLPGQAQGQAPPRTPPSPPTPAAPLGPLLSRVGVDAAARLMRSTDPDDRLRGIERAASTHTNDARLLLERAAGIGSSGGVDPRMPPERLARSDPRALLATVRGLADWTDHESARLALASIVRDPAESLASRPAAPAAWDPAADDAMAADRVLLARQQAAIALASSTSAAAIDGLVAIARSGGPGQGAALDALALLPPDAPTSLGGATLTTPGTIALATAMGDLRAVDGILAATGVSDPILRAAAIAAMGATGDLRGLPIARDAAHDEDARVRVAAADTLVRLGSPECAPTIEALVADDTTALEGLRLARDCQDERVIKAVAARAAASDDATLRATAVESLGRQAGASAMSALVTLAADPLLAGDVASALARSPSSAAMAALDGMALASSQAQRNPGHAPSSETRRLVARAYFVRRFTRGERHPPLDALLDALAASTDARDRAVAVEARVALGLSSFDAAWSDTDARVRRAAVLGAVAPLLRDRGSSLADGLLARIAQEPDETTRRLLMVGLAGAPGSDAEGRLPTSLLLERAHSGSGDAPLAALALADRADDAQRGAVDALLASHDPVLRASTARGLGASAAPDAGGRLAQAYAWEGDAAVRRALLEALAQRTGDGGASARRDALALAARLEPDRRARAIAAAAAAAGLPRSAGRSAGDQNATRTARRQTTASPTVAWLRLVAADGAAIPRGGVALFATESGLAIPIAFDDDGYALVPGVAPGAATVRLAPALPSVTGMGP